MTDKAASQSPPTLEELRLHRDEIIALARRNKAFNVRVFGSVARGDAQPESDIDILVAFQPGASLFELSALWQDLRDMLGREVNVISEGGVSERFRQRIADDVIAL
jgi:uncharacterized protein